MPECVALHKHNFNEVYDYFFFSAFSLQAFVLIAVHVLKKKYYHFVEQTKSIFLPSLLYQLCHDMLFLFWVHFFFHSFPLRYRIVIEVQSRPLTISFWYDALELCMNKHTTLLHRIELHRMLLVFRASNGHSENNNVFFFVGAEWESERGNERENRMKKSVIEIVSRVRNKRTTQTVSIKTNNKHISVCLAPNDSSPIRLIQMNKYLGNLGVAHERKKKRALKSLKFDLLW